LTLYHFTRRSALPGILHNGLTKGDVPLDLNTGINAVCLTVRDSPPRQALRNGQSGADDKTGIRIAVEVDPHDPALLRWKHFPVRFKVDTRFFRALNRGIEGSPVYDWYVYLATLPTERFLEVRDMFAGRPIPSESWEAITAEPVTESVLSDWIRVLPLHEVMRDNGTNDLRRCA
jgi:hypothetical protein